MKDCCQINDQKNNSCIRKKDNKEFNLPRLYSKEYCLELNLPIKGFTKRASCAPYLSCKRQKTKKPKKKRTKTKKQMGGNKSKNILNKDLEICSTNPMTGFYRNGYCETGIDDSGTHTVCAKMDKEFLDYTKTQGNDLYSVVQPGQNWCLCEYRWNQAYLKNKAPKVIKRATNIKTKTDIVTNINNHS